MWPQYVFLAILVIQIGVAMGKQKQIGVTLIGVGITFWLLYEGRFWSPLGWGL